MSERVVVELRCAPADAEMLADRLLVLGASAVAEMEGGALLVADLDPARLESLESLDRTRSAGPPFTWRTVDVDPVWGSAWRDHARVWRAGGFVVRPPWLVAEVTAGETELVVDPGDAFGSGSHPTTRLCLEVVSSLVRGGERVLDVGCGSGVLAVAALRRGAARAVAIDTDPAAVTASRSVALANGVADRLEVSDLALAGVQGCFDLVLANLLVAVIEDLGAALVARVGDGGSLVVSGLLGGQEDRAVAALHPLAVAATLVEDDWLALVMRAD